MSEYQYIHFLACDKPLDDKQLAYMQQQSSRADVSRWSFTNEYHFGDFHGDAAGMLRRGYDLHLHFADFGIRKLMIRLPRLPCSAKDFAAYRDTNGLTWEQDAKGPAGILALDPYAEPDTYGVLEEDASAVLPRLMGLREMLMQGDLRPLYLGWLAAEEDPTATEPPVPAGLGQLNAPLAALAEFYELPDRLITAAAEGSAPAPPPDTDAQVNAWIEDLPENERKQIIAKLLTGDAATLRADLLKQFRAAVPVAAWPTAAPARTRAQLDARA